MESNVTDPAAKEVTHDTAPAKKEVSSGGKPVAKEVSQKSRNFVSRRSQGAAVNRNPKNRGPSNPLDAKWIHVYVNGDEHFPGFKCVINSKYYRNFDAFLSYLTEKLRPSFGAVRNVYTPFSGHTIRTLEELRPNQKYVVAGSEKFKKLEPGYADIGFKAIKRSELKPTFKRKPSSLKSRAPLDQNPTTLYFYKNGSQRTKPQKLMFQTKELGNIERLYDKIKYKLQCESIKRLYTLNGKPVNNLNELQNEQSYVVVEKYEVFKAISYGAHQVKDRQFLKEHQKRLVSPGNSRIPIAVTNSAKQSDSEEKSADTVDQNNENVSSVKSDFESNVVSETEKVEEVFSEETEKEGEVFTQDTLGKSKVDLSNFSSSRGGQLKYEPPATYELSFHVKELDLDVDLGGVYRAKEKYFLTEGAPEVQDDAETAVEIVPDEDDLDAEEIDEEEEITPDMERSMQHLSLDPPNELVAFLPSMQGKQPTANNERVSSDKYNLSQSQTFESQNLIM